VLALKIADGGNVGIGTSAPLQKLHVVGTVQATGFSGSGALVTSIDAANISTGSITIARGGTGVASLTSNKVLVGNGTTAVLQPTNLHWDDANSRLGISTATPAATLHVNGDIQSPALVGQVSHFARNAAPTGWLKCNGSAVSRTAYAALYSAIGTTFGVGDGSTTFNVPDLRGEFIRGWDDGRTVDNGRGFGSFQNHQVQDHEHRVYTNNAVSGTADGVNNAYAGWNGAIWLSVPSHGTTGIYNGSGRYTTLFGAETRPRNYALLACIKF
jgi:microcystin-dependent protein